MHTTPHTSTSVRRILSATLAASTILALPLALTACEKDVSKSSSTTTKTVETPEGTKKTTETTEKKIETEHKKP